MNETSSWPPACFTTKSQPVGILNFSENLYDNLYDILLVMLRDISISSLAQPQIPRHVLGGSGGYFKLLA